MEKTIISLDDFGSSFVANTKILKITYAGKADRVSIMANGKFTKKEVESLLISGVKLDIHLDVNVSVEKGRKLKKRVLGRVLLFFKNYISGKASPEKIRLLWEKQIRDFRNEFGRNPDGLNSHEHIHFFPPYFKIAVEVAKKYDMRYIRLGRKDYNCLKPISFILNILRKFDRKYFLNSGLFSSNFVVSSDWVNNFDFEKCKKNPFELKGAEIIFHPEREEEFLFLKNSN